MASASINNIKGRIKSVESTMQITKAMELVATSKLRHLKDRAEKTKPYMQALLGTLSIIKSSTESVDAVFGKSGNDAKELYIVIAGDRGLAGGYNSNIMKMAKYSDPESKAAYIPVGKKAQEYFLRRGCDIFDQTYKLAGSVGVKESKDIAQKVCDSFLSGEISSVKIIYTSFVSMLTQTPICKQILPLCIENDKFNANPIIEEDAEELVRKIIPDYISGIVYAALAESTASECAARRTAMNSANKNAEEMIGDLTLKFNRARQAVITQEITEIVSGAEAL